MKKYLYFLLLIFILSSCAYQLYQPINQVGADGKKQGLWKTYWEEGNLMMKTCFKDGKERGISRTYYANGERVSVFKFHRDYVKVKFYDTLGNLEMKGKAKLFYDEDSTLTYYWFGKWKFFDPAHRLVEYGYYSEGKEDTVFVPKKKKRVFRFEKLTNF